jgi:capsular polysaccharide biosynthesis protein
MDFLPSLFKIKEERNNQDIPILVSQLTDRQREIIALFGLNFNFFEIEPSTPRSLKIINLSAADISLAISPVAKATFFRNEVQLIQKRTMHLNSGINGLKRTLFYFKRNGNETPSRVSNHAEIGNELEKIGFSSLQCDCLNIQELIATLADAKVVVAEPGTPASNFFNFCPKDCKLIWLMPQYASDAKDLNVNEPVFDVISRNIENVYVFPGEIVDGAYSWSTPHTYSAHRLTELVRKLITL